ncbi:hypothetical protein QLQ12_29095 [Actinoplanes sp. NEAU-A12]|uniref:Uncharacterized protein n=1 Tax=Actinoplanes sandaracinus TaxID=3045177 RepID=A0ABT6WSG1_9ACTN|nr:hypothetical protein [Actinoplanes sandaracinus]MDI6102683.1 hypothetical protein [Actinoplanes sandaracinus]
MASASSTCARHDRLAGVAALTGAMRSAVQRRWPRLAAVPVAASNPVADP